ncbi:hypothetical protein [Streptomyces sp. NPDC005731]|uniref:hypothetical protein n=1 Tax=Streptomyces sp. NPDC005731 TaxID=3157056 RepID=UPI0033DE4B94
MEPPCSIPLGAKTWLLYARAFGDGIPGPLFMDLRRRVWHGEGENGETLVSRALDRVCCFLYEALTPSFHEFHERVDYVYGKDWFERAASTRMNGVGELLLDAPQAFSRAELDSLVRDGSVPSVPACRLVILGEPGAGESALLIRLPQDLIAHRTAGAPVPVLFSLGERLQTREGPGRMGF